MFFYATKRDGLTNQKQTLSDILVAGGFGTLIPPMDMRPPAPAGTSGRGATGETFKALSRPFARSDGLL
jgi:hypothetical protein